jgi:hypothetical protein
MGKLHTMMMQRHRGIFLREKKLLSLVDTLTQTHIRGGATVHHTNWLFFKIVNLFLYFLLLIGYTTLNPTTRKHVNCSEEAWSSKLC